MKDELGKKVTILGGCSIGADAIKEGNIVDKHYAQIAEAAAYAVPAKDHGQEDEVMVALMIIKGSKIEYSKWINKVSADLAKFAIPLYLRVMKNFPKTQTGKIIKHALRTEGITNDTWKNNL